MKRFATATALALLVSALPAHAAGIGLRWNSCEGASNRNFACDRSTGSEVLVASVSPPGGINEMTGMVAYLRISTADGNIPAWWQMFYAGSCRQRSIQSVFDVSDQAECDDPWEGQAMGGVARYLVGGATGVDLWVAAAVPSSLKHALTAGRTYAAFKLVINHMSSGSGSACSGCEVPVCISLERVVIAQYSPQDPVSNKSQSRESEITLGLPSSGSTPGNVVTWQGGTANCGAGVSKPSSWSQVKDRYRTHRP